MQVSDNFGPIYQSVVLDGSGYGAVSFQATGSNIRLTNVFFNVAPLPPATAITNQAVCNIYKGQIAPGNIVLNSNSGSTGARAGGNLDLFDGETCYVVWTGGDAGATATATFTGGKVPFGEIKPSNLEAAEPFAAGDGTIIFPALKSPDYVAGVSGWKLDRSGDAEFNDVVVRGEVIAASGNGGYVAVNNDANQPGIRLMPQFSFTGEVPAVIYAANNVDSDEWPLLVLFSPSPSNFHASSVVLYGESETGVLVPTVSLNADEVNINADLTRINTARVDGDFTITGSLSMESAYATFSGNIANNTITALTPSSMLANNHGIWTAGSSFTVQVAGTYNFGCTFRYATNAVGQRSAQLFLNGSQLVYQTQDASTGGMAGTNVTAQIQTVENLVVGDVVSFRAYQNSGGALNLNYGRMWITQQPI
jgi:hypothetical protein